jgi:predicted Zn-dependent protease
VAKPAKKGRLNRGQVLIDALTEELARSMSGLTAGGGHPSPYYISYLCRDTEEWSLWASYGAIWQDNRSRTRRCLADVRVGSPTYDQVSSGGLQDNSTEDESFDMIDMPVEDNREALRFAVWRLTDAKYREAVTDYYNRKSRDLSFVDLSQSVASFSVEKSERSIAVTRQRAIDYKRLRGEARVLSKIFKKFPEIKNSYVEFSARLQTKTFVNSEGTVRVWQEPLYEWTVHFWFLGADHDDHSITVASRARTLAALPTKNELRRQILKAVRECYETHRGTRLSSYAGPVLLSPRAAGLFLHEAVGHRLESSRFLSDDEGRHFQDQLGQVIMHPDISLYDDPTLTHWAGTELIGHYPYDDEGMPAKRAELVESGKLVGYLSTRAPFPSGAGAMDARAKRAGPRRARVRLQGLSHQSNGHARSQGHERPISRMANLVCESSSRLDWAELRDQLVEEVRRRGLPFGLILYDVEGGETGTDAYDFQAFLGQITSASKVFADGREERIRGVDFVGTPLASLNQIIAVGSKLEVDNGYCGAESGLIPVSTVAPALLLGNLELQSKDPTKVTHYILPIPWIS